MNVTDTEQAAARVRDGRERILTELHKVIVGQDEVLDLVLIALFTGGHCLITGVPGLAKTLLVKTLARVLHLTFKRIQFTPDLMPADITGTEVLEESDGHRALRFVKGPVFAQIILADEINRTPPKTQSALLEAMQEYQLSRFMFNVVMSYLPEDDEVRVVTTTTSDEHGEPERILDGADILEFQRLVRQVVVSDEVARYAVRLVDASRPGRANTPEFVERWVRWGAGLRASQALILGGKARALMQGRYHVSVEDVRRLAPPTLRHRLVTNFFAESEGIDAETGFSVEFSEYRQYMPGDDTALIDWKLYARSDRHYVKKFEEETNLECHLLLDVSGSMGYGSGGVTKQDTGRTWPPRSRTS
ncbi:Uncharacterized protein YeaC [Geodia barretti]|uniref:magnesium chelatase n=1 Tax=Geodia barretti TaxID=519541 RepID=A0AA35RV87_GEOBA|nr:Uncharacterized protein YeaC [Geodia barretti]